MNEVMRPIPFNKLINWIQTEYKKGTIFGIHKEKFYFDDSKNEIFGQKISSIIGPAAGPNSQLAQNIVASYLAGARFFELKTVQTVDGEDLRKLVARPCINAYDECYNVEWSTELTVYEAMNEYIKAWIAINVLRRELNISDKQDFVFNVSVGYDLDGIKSKKIDDYLNNLMDSTNTDVWKDAIYFLEGNLDKFKFDAEFIETLSPQITNSVTLSTLHGCPPEEIERIAEYLITEKHMNTYVKCNPTLLGYDYARKTLDDLGYDYISFDDHHFKNDLQYSDAVPMFKRLLELAKKYNLQFGLKLTNTFPVKNERGELPGEEMYMSGRSLYPLTINLASKLASEFIGKLPISFSGGADYFNIRDIALCGLKPITVATTILKPGGYERLFQLANEIVDINVERIDYKFLESIARKALNNPFNEKEYRPVYSRKTTSELPMFDCYKAPCKDGGCPINQQIPEYLNLVSQGKYKEALEVILIDNALPAITGTICDHQCQYKCTRLDYDESLKIRDAKKQAVDKAMDEYLAYLEPTDLKTNKKVAIIGAGPAGIANAIFLRRNGVSVTVYEKRDRPLGIIEYIIPEFRVPSYMINRDYNLAVRNGVEFVFNAREEYDIESLKEVYDYIIIATGSWNKGYNPLPNAKTYEALDFLYESKRNDLNLNLGKTVLVIGGGDVSMDCARASLHTPGVEKVYLTYRRTKEVMPASLEEIQLARQDGVELMFLTSPIEYDGNTVILQRNKLVNNKAVKTDETFKLQVDTIINAIGTKVDDIGLIRNKIPQDEYGYAIINAFNETKLEDVYVAGDCKEGAKTVVKAIADAKKITIDILAKLNLENDFIEVEVDSDIYRKKGILTSSIENDSSRCLACDEVCEICVEVCPNRANVVFDIPELGNQIIHIDGMCNECGNCSVFCPHIGNPYKDKFTIFWTKEDFESSKNQGLLKQDNGLYLIRYDGKVLNYKDGIDCDFEITAIIKVIEDKYNYLLV